jgi:hypothetical protein
MNDVARHFVAARLPLRAASLGINHESAIEVIEIWTDRM